MDPLIELPEPAKARIKAQEAKAAEQFDLVRRACADDEACAHRTWGGYFDLHTDDLQDAIERARRPLTEASGIYAQFVYHAHAVEYRSALPNPRELEPVLARLREAIITKYGEQVRLAIQRLEAEEFAKAWPEERAGARGSAPLQVSPASDLKRMSPDDPSYTVPAQHIGMSAGAEVADRQQKVAHASENVPRPILSPPGKMVPSSSRAIVMHPFGSAKVAHIRVPKMTYAFPADYPDAARRSFLAKRLYAERMVEERKASIEDFQTAEALLLDFVLQLLLAFAEEAHSVGMQGDLTAADMESECLKFLRSYVLEAGLMDSFFLVVPGGDTQIPDSLQARIESSDKWGQYRELLQNVADSQAHELFIWPTISGDPPERQSDAPDRVPPRRTPNLKSSRERLDLVNALARELVTIKKELSRFITVEGLKKKYPDFILWGHILDAELQELVDGEAFTPKAYAENLTLRKFGITSRATLKKDRQKLRKADKTGPA